MKTLLRLAHLGTILLMALVIFFMSGAINTLDERTILLNKYIGFVDNRPGYTQDCAVFAEIFGWNLRNVYITNNGQVECSLSGGGQSRIVRYSDVRVYLQKYFVQNTKGSI
jgi:hypothetical protein